MDELGGIYMNDEQNQMHKIQEEEILKLTNQFVNKIFKHYNQGDFNAKRGFLNRQEIRKPFNLSSIQSQGRPIEEVMKEEIDALELDANLRHPRYYGFIPGPAEYVSWLGDMIATSYNSHVGGWHLAPGASAMEKEVIHWAIQQVGLKGEHAGGILESGGTMAGFTALAAARDAKVSVNDISKATVYMTRQTHTANHKALHLLGIPKENWRYVDTESFQMQSDDLERQIQADQEKGLIPIIVIGTCGTTNTGAIDPLDQIARICEKYQLWFHVDGAYGASVVLSNQRHLAKGIEKADSIVWDGHKWLYQIYGIAFCLVKDIRYLLNTYRAGGEYLQDVESTTDKPDWWDMGPELTRPARGPRLWMTLQTFGTEKLSAMINQSMKYAEWFEAQVKQSKRLELVTAASLGIVTFKVKAEQREESERKNILLSETLRKYNIAGIFTTMLNDENVLRICTISPEESLEDFKDMYQSIENTMDKLGM